MVWFPEGNQGKPKADPGADRQEPEALPGRRTIRPEEERRERNISVATQSVSPETGNLFTRFYLINRIRRHLRFRVDVAVGCRSVAVEQRRSRAGLLGSRASCVRLARRFHGPVHPRSLSHLPAGGPMRIDRCRRSVTHRCLKCVYTVMLGSCMLWSSDAGASPGGEITIESVNDYQPLRSIGVPASDQINSYADVTGLKDTLLFPPLNTQGYTAGSDRGDFTTPPLTNDFHDTETWYYPAYAEDHL